MLAFVPHLEIEKEKKKEGEGRGKGGQKENKGEEAPSGA